MWDLKYEDKVFILSRGTSIVQPSRRIFFIYWLKILRSLLIAQSHDNEAPIAVQCNMSNRSPRGYYHICKQMKILKKSPARFGVSNSQGTQKTETITEECFTERVHF